MEEFILVSALWVMVATVLVVLMQGGFILLEAGSTRMKNAGHVAGKTIFCFGIASLVWWAVGYGFSYGDTIGSFIGSSNFFFGDATSTDDGFPLSIDFVFQLAFAGIALTIALGGFIERAKLSVYLLFSLLFSAFVYPIVAHWIWGDGWLAGLEKQDFAGSTVVHLTGAMAALAATILLKPRLGKYKNGKVQQIEGHNQVYTVLGVLILWVGWFGFNAGSALGANQVAVSAFLATHAAAASASLSWMVVEWLHRGTPTVLGIASGAVAGLATITPGAGWDGPVRSLSPLELVPRFRSGLTIRRHRL
jgi:ammonium transporter, Amt family